MTEFALGYACGTLTIGLLWLLNTKQRSTIVIQNAENKKMEVIEDSAPVTKPDNKRVREVMSPDFRREMLQLKEIEMRRARISKGGDWDSEGISRTDAIRRGSL